MDFFTYHLGLHCLLMSYLLTKKHTWFEIERFSRINLISIICLCTNEQPNMYVVTMRVLTYIGPDRQNIAA